VPLVVSRQDAPYLGGLQRQISGWGLLALTVNCVVGAGILGLPGRVFALAGPFTIAVLIGAGLLAAAVALCLAELAGRFDGPGGPALYLNRAFGPAAGFAGGWLSWSATVLGSAYLLNLAASFAPPRLGATHDLVVVALAIVLTGLAMTGARRSTRASALLTLVKFALLATVAAAGLLAHPSPAQPLSGPTHPAAALVLVFFAFVGFERPTAVAGEVLDPQRKVPITLLAAVAVIALLYAAIFAACLRDLPGLARSDHPVGELAARCFGPAATGAVELGSTLIVFGTLASQWITAPRLLLALAEARQAPAWLGRLSPGRHTPDLAIGVTGASAAVLALQGGFAAAAAASSASRLLIFFGCAAALLRLRRQADAPPAHFRLPGAAWIAPMVLTACIVLLVMAFAELRQLAVLVSIGGFLWLLTSWRARLRRPR
jgi:APA family basic amino acid/polyamine antiporter